MEKIKYIELVFENCESCKLTPDMFKYFYMNGIKDTLRINCFQYEEGEYELSKTCDYFQIYINEKGLSCTNGLFEGTLEKRLSNYFGDITFVCVTYEDDTEVQYFVSWNEDNEYQNKYQTHYRDDEYCVITIERNDNG